MRQVGSIKNEIARENIPTESSSSMMPPVHRKSRGFSLGGWSISNFAETFAVCHGPVDIIQYKDWKVG